MRFILPLFYLNLATSSSLGRLVKCTRVSRGYISEPFAAREANVDALVDILATDQLKLALKTTMLASYRILDLLRPLIMQYGRIVGAFLRNEPNPSE